MRTLRVRGGGTAEGHGGEVFSCAWTADGAFVLSAGWDGYLRLWLAESGQPVTALPASAKPLSACTLSPDGLSWVSGTMDGVLTWWDAVSHQMKLNAIAHIRPISSIQFAPDGKSVATASWDRKLLVRRVGLERDPQALCGHHDIVAGCRWTPDGRQLLSWSHDRTLRLWDVETGREAARLSGHEDRVTAACLSPDGAWAVSGGRDGVVKLWDLARRAELRSVKLKAEVRGCWCLPDGASVITANADGWMVLWSLPDFGVQAELASDIRAMCGDLSPLGTEVVLGSEDGRLHFVTVEGAENAPIPVTASPTFKPKSGVISRFLGKQRVERAYRFTCPACRNTAELPRLPDEVVSCPSCRRPLRLRAEAAQQHVGA